MSARADGGPAFPAYASDHRGKAANTVFQPTGGLTLRDYFAAGAMEAILSLGAGYDYSRMPPSAEPRFVIAADAYKLADAMLSARQESAADGYRELRDTLRTIEAESTDDNAREWARRALEEFGDLA